MRLEAWVIMHSKDGLVFTDLHFCPEGEGPDLKPENWSADAWIRLRGLMPTVRPDDFSEARWRESD